MTMCVTNVETFWSKACEVSECAYVHVLCKCGLSSRRKAQCPREINMLACKRKK